MRSGWRGPVRRGGLRRRRAGRHRRPAGQHPVGDRRLARGHSGEPRLVLALVDGDQAVRAGQAGQQAGREGGEQPLDAAPGVPGAAEHVGQPGRDQVVHVIAGHDPDRGRAGPQIGREGVPGDRDPGQRHTEHGAVQERGRFHAGPGADNPGGRFAGQAGRADRLVGGHGRDVRGPGGGRGRPRPGRRRGPAGPAGLVCEPRRDPGRISRRIQPGRDRDAQAGQPAQGPLPLAALVTAAGDQPPAEPGEPLGQAVGGADAVQRVEGRGGVPADHDVGGGAAERPARQRPAELRVGGQVVERVVPGEPGVGRVVAAGPGQRPARGAGQLVRAELAGRVLRQRGPGGPGGQVAGGSGGGVQQPAPDRGRRRARGGRGRGEDPEHGPAVGQRAHAEPAAAALPRVLKPAALQGVRHGPAEVDPGRARGPGGERRRAVDHGRVAGVAGGERPRQGQGRLGPGRGHHVGLHVDRHQHPRLVQQVRVPGAQGGHVQAGPGQHAEPGGDLGGADLGRVVGGHHCPPSKRSSSWAIPIVGRNSAAGSDGGPPARVRSPNTAR